MVTTMSASRRGRGMVEVPPLVLLLLLVMDFTFFTTTTTAAAPPSSASRSAASSSRRGAASQQPPAVWLIPFNELVELERDAATSAKVEAGDRERGQRKQRTSDSTDSSNNRPHHHPLEISWWVEVVETHKEERGRGSDERNPTPLMFTPNGVNLSSSGKFHRLASPSSSRTKFTTDGDGTNQDQRRQQQQGSSRSVPGGGRSSSPQHVGTMLYAPYDLPIQATRLDKMSAGEEDHNDQMFFFEYFHQHLRQRRWAPWRNPLRSGVVLHDHSLSSCTNNNNNKSSSSSSSSSWCCRSTEEDSPSSSSSVLTSVSLLLRSVPLLRNLILSLDDFFTDVFLQPLCDIEEDSSSSTSSWRIGLWQAAEIFRRMISRAFSFTLGFVLSSTMDVLPQEVSLLFEQDVDEGSGSTAFGFHASSSNQQGMSSQIRRGGSYRLHLYPPTVVVPTDEGDSTTSKEKNHATQMKSTPKPATDDTNNNGVAYVCNEEHFGKALALREHELKKSKAGSENTPEEEEEEGSSIFHSLFSSRKKKRRARTYHHHHQGRDEASTQKRSEEEGERTNEDTDGFWIQEICGGGSSGSTSSSYSYPFTPWVKRTLLGQPGYGTREEPTLVKVVTTTKTAATSMKKRVSIRAQCELRLTASVPVCIRLASVFPRLETGDAEEDDEEDLRARSGGENVRKNKEQTRSSRRRQTVYIYPKIQWDTFFFVCVALAMTIHLLRPYFEDSLFLQLLLAAIFGVVVVVLFLAFYIFNDLKNTRLGKVGFVGLISLGGFAAVTEGLLGAFITWSVLELQRNSTVQVGLLICGVASAVITRIFLGEYLAKTTRGIWSATESLCWLVAAAHNREAFLFILMVRYKVYYVLFLWTWAAFKVSYKSCKHMFRILLGRAVAGRSSTRDTGASRVPSYDDDDDDDPSVKIRRSRYQFDLEGEPSDEVRACEEQDSDDDVDDKGRVSAAKRKRQQIDNNKNTAGNNDSDRFTRDQLEELQTIIRSDPKKYLAKSANPGKLAAFAFSAGTGEAPPISVRKRK